MDIHKLKLFFFIPPDTKSFKRKSQKHNCYIFVAQKQLLCQRSHF